LGRDAPRGLAQFDLLDEAAPGDEVDGEAEAGP
jgi:hypothetical protein